MISLILVTFISNFEALAQTPDDILKKADEVRNPSNSFKMIVQVKSGNDINVFDVSLKGKDKTLIKTMEPPRDRGRNMLMIEQDMWAYVPNLKRSVRMSLNQKLSGQAANGDIARTRWYGDYNAKIDKEDKDTWTLFLEAKRKGLTYDKMRIVVKKLNFHPLTAEYLSKSGSLLKRAEFQDYTSMEGKLRPKTIRIADAHQESDFSIITIRSMTSQEFPDALFSQNNLQ